MSVDVSPRVQVVEFVARVSSIDARDPLPVDYAHGVFTIKAREAAGTSENSKDAPGSISFSGKVALPSNKKSEP